MNPLPPPVEPPPAVEVPFFGLIAADLAEVERLLHRTLASSRGHTRRLLNHLRHYRGKRLRPALLLLAAHASGGIRPVHHVLAAVVEMIHTATLVHDDVLDHAAVRRHAATVNAAWGNHASILLGDYLFTHAFHLASTVDARACSLIGQATNRVCEGELHQIGERGNLELTEEEYLEIIDGKTAELTACCGRLGALYADAPDDFVTALGHYGRWLGLAFQIADDLLDLVGSEERTGKSLGTDLEQNKLTLPVIHLLRESPPATATVVRQLLSSPGNHKRTALSPYLSEHGSLDYARRRAEGFATLAREELASLPPSPGRAVLELLTERVVHRQS
ncbi:MAG: polyprenyl synthetase family protein [Gemmataceae bacterium]|nr:polyprenyl synthetase family protein [Gemmataceae bacterium]MDW8265052.1 polyprenyl synthetase family protein [Gemmataceae bacterium]